MGEYDTDNEGRDCKELMTGGEVCNHGVQTVPIESIILHPDFDFATSYNDIAIIRLKYPVRYTGSFRSFFLVDKWIICA